MKEYPGSKERFLYSTFRKARSQNFANFLEVDPRTRTLAASRCEDLSSESQRSLLRISKPLPLGLAGLACARRVRRVQAFNDVATHRCGLEFVLFCFGFGWRRAFPITFSTSERHLGFCCYLISAGTDLGGIRLHPLTPREDQCIVVGKVEKKDLRQSCSAGSRLQRKAYQAKRPQSCKNTARTQSKHASGIRKGLLKKRPLFANFRVSISFRNEGPGVLETLPPPKKASHLQRLLGRAGNVTLKLISNTFQVLALAAKHDATTLSGCAVACVATAGAKQFCSLLQIAAANFRCVGSLCPKPARIKTSRLRNNQNRTCNQSPCALSSA